jgi:hypothetical protein
VSMSVILIIAIGIFLAAVLTMIVILLFAKD